MTVGLVIPGVATLHTREDWLEPCYPMVGPAQRPANITQPVAHYSGALDLPDGDIGEFENEIPPFIRASQRDYWLHRDGTGLTICGRYLPGYALGYMWWIDWLGGVWEVRGFDYQSAANADHNTYTAPIMFISDRDDPVSELAWQSARAVWREHRRRSGRADFKNRPLGHGELRTTTGIGTPTACPGAAILNQLHQGLGDLDYQGDDMFIPWQQSVRAYDSRPSEQVDVDPTLQKANRDLGVPLGPLKPNESRRVFVGLASAAEIILHSIGNGESGFLRLSGYPTPPTTSLVNFYGSDRIEDNSQIIGLTDGSVWVHAGPAACDFIVEVANRW